MMTHQLSPQVIASISEDMYWADREAFPPSGGKIPVDREARAFQDACTEAGQVCCDWDDWHIEELAADRGLKLTAEDISAIRGSFVAATKFYAGEEQRTDLVDALRIQVDLSTPTGPRVFVWGGADEEQILSALPDGWTVKDDDWSHGARTNNEGWAYPLSSSL